MQEAEHFVWYSKFFWTSLSMGKLNKMSDFEDSLSPTWDNIMRGHINLKDAVEGTIKYEDKARNRTYNLNDKTDVLFVRPRGWHLPEAHVEIDGQPATGCLVDFGLYLYHIHATFRMKNGGSGPFFYLPKMEHSRMTEEAINSDPWGPETRRMGDISRAAFQVDDYSRIVNILHKSGNRCVLQGISGCGGGKFVYIRKQGTTQLLLHHR